MEVRQQRERACRVFLSCENQIFLKLLRQRRLAEKGSNSHDWPGPRLHTQFNPSQSAWHHINQPFINMHLPPPSQKQQQKLYFYSFSPDWNRASNLVTTEDDRGGKYLELSPTFGAHLKYNATTHGTILSSKNRISKVWTSHLWSDSRRGKKILPNASRVEKGMFPLQHMWYQHYLSLWFLPGVWQIFFQENTPTQAAVQDEIWIESRCSSPTLWTNHVTAQAVGWFCESIEYHIAMFYFPRRVWSKRRGRTVELHPPLTFLGQRKPLQRLHLSPSLSCSLFRE